MAILHMEREKNLKVDVESEKIKESQNNPDQKEFDGRQASSFPMSSYTTKP